MLISQETISLPSSQHRVSFSVVDRHHKVESRPKKFSYEFDNIEEDLSMISPSMVASIHSIEPQKSSSFNQNTHLRLNSHSKLKDISSFIS